MSSNSVMCTVPYICRKRNRNLPRYFLPPSPLTSPTQKCHPCGSAVSRIKRVRSSPRKPGAETLKFPGSRLTLIPIPMSSRAYEINGASLPLFANTGRVSGTRGHKDIYCLPNKNRRGPRSQALSEHRGVRGVFLVLIAHTACLLVGPDVVS